MREVRVNGTVVENTFNGGNVEEAFKVSRSNAQLIERTAKGVKLLKEKKARGFPLKEIARFVQ